MTMTQAKNLIFYFWGPLFTSHWLNLQHWTGFYIAVYGNFQGLFFIFEGSFLPFGDEIAQSPCAFFPCHDFKWLAFNIIVEGHNTAEFLDSHNTAVDPRPFHRVGVGSQDGEGGLDQGLLVGEEDTSLGKLDQQDLRIFQEYYNWE